MFNLLAPSLESPVEGFNFVDVIVIVLVLLLMLRGLTVGFQKKGLGIIGFFIVVVGTILLTPIAFNWFVNSIGKGLYETLYKVWESLIVPASVGDFAFYSVAVVVGLVIFFLLVIVAHILGWLVKKINVKHGFIAFWDKFLGALLYVVVWGAVFVLLIWIVHTVKIPKVDDFLSSCFIVKITEPFLGPIFALFTNPLAALGL